MAYKKPYDIKKVGCNIGIGEDAFPVDGVNKLMAARSTDEYTVVVAADGATRLNKNNDRTGLMTVGVNADSKAHVLIDALHKAGISFPVAFVDKTSDGAVAFGDGCRLQKLPDWNREAEPTEIEYVFVAQDLEIKHAGAADE